MTDLSILAIIFPFLLILMKGINIPNKFCHRNLEAETNLSPQHDNVTNIPMSTISLCRHFEDPCCQPSFAPSIVRSKSSRQ